MTIAEALRQAGRLTDSDTAQLDVELLLADLLGRNRSYLYTWPERTLTEPQQLQFEARFQRRLAGEPVAHILGRRGFWTLDLEVTADTLIPRPETELLVEVGLELLRGLEAGPRLLDLGTGTGAIALAFARELPDAEVVATDYLDKAVALAERNRRKYALANVEIRQSNWWQSVNGHFDLIVSNPPYIDEADPHLQQGDVRFEPRSALVAGEQGLADLREIVQSAPRFLRPRGWLLLEHGWQQAEAVRRLLTAAGFAGVFSRHDYGDQERISGGQWHG